MEELQKIEQVQSTIDSLHSVGVSDADPDGERFLLQFTFLLMKPCGELDISSKCRLITEHMSKITTGVGEGALQCLGEGFSNIGNALPLYCEEKTSNISYVPSFRVDVSMVGIDAMKHSNSTLEDFCRSYFMFHKMEANHPHSIFRFLPMLSFTESYIYQLDGLNEKLVKLTQDGVPNSSMGFEVFQKDPFRPLCNVLQSHGLLTERITEEFRYGGEYWALERKLCGALERNKDICIEDAKRAIHLKSFDYRVLNLLLYQLTGQKDDVVENNFNILRMFVKYYGASAAPIMMEKFITEAEEKHEQLSKALDPDLSMKYHQRCEEATREGYTSPLNSVILQFFIKHSSKSFRWEDFWSFTWNMAHATCDRSRESIPDYIFI